MEHTQFGSHYVLRLEPGEEVMFTLCAFVEREGIHGGYFVAFGALSRVCLKYFDVEENRYRENEVDRQVEVVSLLGNIAVKDGRPKLHLHGAFGDRDANTYSGHVAEGVVRPTLEVFLTDLGGVLQREQDPATGLDLLSLARSGDEPGLAEAIRTGRESFPYTP